jgi:hypothetical protein
MMSDGLWLGKVSKSSPLHQSRQRRPCFGELVQIDGSHRNWFEGRRAKCSLLVFIDDATSHIVSSDLKNLRLRRDIFEGLQTTLRRMANHFLITAIVIVFLEQHETSTDITKTRSSIWR